VARPRRSPVRSFARDRRAWALVLTLVPAALAGGHLWRHRQVFASPQAFPGGVVDPRIVVLAYGRVVTDPDGVHVDAERLRTHLAKLRASGFAPVTLAALRSHLDEGRPLPARSLLLTFDHGYLSTYEAVDPLLRDVHWPAVMFLTTRYQEARDPGFLYWDRLQCMVDSGIWEIGSHGHRGHEEVPVGAAGEQGPFFVRRMWLALAHRTETIDEFAARLDDDYRRGKAAIEEHVRGTQVVAYAPPLASPGLITTDPEIHETTRRLLRSRFLLTFSEDGFGVNGSLATAHGLRRLRVSPEWSDAELVERLTHALDVPTATAARTDAVDQPARWAVGSGELHFADKELIVKGTPRADVWRAGSQWAEEWGVEADVRTDGGQFWIVQQDATGTKEWRFGGHAERTYVQTRQLGEHAETLAHFDTGIVPGQWHHLKLNKRGCGIWVEWDGRVLSERPVYLPDRWSGPLGCVTWQNETHLRLANLRFAPLRYRVQAMGGEPSREEVEAAIHSGGDLAAVSPLWIDVEQATLKEHTLDRQLFAILSRRYGWEIVPTLRILPAAAGLRSADGVESAWLAEAAKRLQGEAWSGIYVDVRALAPAHRQAVAARIADLVQLSPWSERRVLLAEQRRRSGAALGSTDADSLLFLPSVANARRIVER
jgi:peptidoglycan/xylan/chitin deacetylase (PgdA/CDA1 family)